MQKLLRRIAFVTFILVVSAITLPVTLAQDDEPRSPDECAVCHEQEYDDWHESDHAAALANPIYIEAWNRAGSPTYCKSCHGTGYDPVSGAVQYEGVGCYACHIDAEGTHPMTPMAAVDSPAVCGNCHTGNHAPDYDQWLVSKHATINIGCSDCHQSHSADLHMESTTALCTSCHKDMDENLHGQQGMACEDCHMAPGTQIVDTLSGRTNSAGHTFNILPSVCSECHGMTHTLKPGDDSAVESTGNTPEQVDDEAAAQNYAQQMSLGVTGGGIAGLLIGIVVPWLLTRKVQK